MSVSETVARSSDNSRLTDAAPVAAAASRPTWRGDCFTTAARPAWTQAGAVFITCVPGLSLFLSKQKQFE